MSTDVFAQALARLPHGPEFRFLDRVTALDPGRTGAGEFTLRGEEPFLRGHFPGEPILPGVLLIEAAAQLGGVVAQSDPALPPLPGLKLTAVRGAKIFGSARPGETVALETEVSARFGNLIHIRASARTGSRKLLETELTLSGSVAPVLRPAG